MDSPYHQAPETLRFLRETPPQLEEETGIFDIKASIAKVSKLHGGLHYTPVNGGDKVSFMLANPKESSLDLLDPLDNSPGHPEKGQEKKQAGY